MTRDTKEKIVFRPIKKYLGSRGHPRFFLTAILLATSLLAIACGSSEEDQAKGIFSQSAALSASLADLTSGLYSLENSLESCMRSDQGGLSCRWASGERSSVQENLSSIDSDAYLQEVISTKERVWDLREEEIGVVFDNSFAILQDGIDASRKDKFARLKDRVSDLASLPYGVIFDRVEAVIDQARQLGFGEDRLKWLTRALETSRIETTELIRRLDNLH